MTIKYVVGRIERAMHSAQLRGVDPRNSHDAMTEAYTRNYKRAMRRLVDQEARDAAAWEEEQWRIEDLLKQATSLHNEIDGLLRVTECGSSMTRPIWEVEGEGEPDRKEADWVHYAGRK